MIEWKKIKKIDAHIHILPDEVLMANPDSDDEWTATNIHKYLDYMNDLNIEKAVIMPFNDPYLMSMNFTVDAVHRNLAEMISLGKGRIYAFADIDPRNSVEDSIKNIREAQERYHFSGLKIHPTNMGINEDDSYIVEILKGISDLHLPVAIHSYPNGDENPQLAFSAANRIAKIVRQFPYITFITSHMGAFEWEELIDSSVYVDFSAILPEYIKRFGIKKTEEILRTFGPKRLIFATDYPTSRSLAPDEIYPFYFDILNKMDFSEDEIQMIAFSNMNALLKRE